MSLLDNHHTQPSTAGNPSDGTPTPARRPVYVAPELLPLGDIRSLTMGASAGSTDSGGLGREPGGQAPSYPGPPSPGGPPDPGPPEPSAP